MQTKPILLLVCLLTTSAFSQTTPTSWDVITAGAKPDGATDNTAIFQHLLDEAGKAGGGVVTVPAGSFRIAGNLNIPANVTLQGIYKVPPTVKSPRTAPLRGSVLEAGAWQISELTARWTGVSARLRLPVVPGKPCTITIKGNFLPQTISPTAGLYLEATQMAPLTAGDTLTAVLPATTQDHIELELRSHGWVPQQLDPKSSDLRTLGVQVSSVEVRAADAGEEIFNANTGEWLANTSPAK